MEYTEQQKRNYNRMLRKYESIRQYNLKKKESRKAQTKESIDNKIRMEWRKAHPR